MTVTLYYSASTGGFYRSDLFGEPTMLVPDLTKPWPMIEIEDPNWERPLKDIPDPDWVRPTKLIPDPAWVRPTIKVPAPGWVRPSKVVRRQAWRLVREPDMAAEHPLIKDEDGETLFLAPNWKRPSREVRQSYRRPEVVVDEAAEHPLVDEPDYAAEHPLIEVPDEGAIAPDISVPDEAAEHPLIMVPDPSAEPSMIAVPNPDCRIPADAVEVTAEQHAALMAAQADGYDIVAGDGGQPIAAERVRNPEQILEANRKYRNYLLGQSDWTQMPDLPVSKAWRAAWASYRQVLRDLDLTETEVVWPVAPE